VREWLSSIVVFLIVVSSAAAQSSPDLPTARQFTSADIPHTLHLLFGDDVAAFTGFSPTIVVSPQRVPNAFARGSSTIVITAGLLAAIDSEDELAFVLAHEVAHLMKHQKRTAQYSLLPPRSRPQSLLELEFDADLFAVRIMERAGLSVGAAASILERNGRFGAEFGAPLSSTHPSLLARLERLKTQS
jgi:Zn-dependent protease with chaperone function